MSSKSIAEKYLVLKTFMKILQQKILLLFNVKFSKFTSKQSKQYPTHCDFKDIGFKNNYIFLYDVKSP